ncbi:hypothetical protein G6R40_00615 [Chryseobacterium sp. POL2]|uniref:hypothetical protein n=1 Tax=Chryseobacterium sp. POL2 TaxID=2713414 RepID=UPI0013E12EA7|nr:hypothetical protein [Chryseobacterium sp. POL2]QIG88244.1 hypothetical protein G6R40_00615 [Chryseobacterium sp. POL2]
MKFLKQALFTIGVLAGGLAFAQDSNMNNMIKVGVNGGISTGGNTSANVGLDVSYQNLVAPGFGLGIATGYNHFFGKSATINNVKVENNDFGVVPVAALFRIYPQQYGFYLGADLGYGFIVGDDTVTNNEVYNTQRPDGGFYMRPEIGYHNKDWNFYAHYTKVFTGDKGQVADQKYNAGTVGVGVSYNLPLGD